MGGRRALSALSSGHILANSPRSCTGDILGDASTYPAHRKRWAALHCSRIAPLRPHQQRRLRFDRCSPTLCAASTRPPSAAATSWPFRLVFFAGDTLDDTSIHPAYGFRWAASHSFRIARHQSHQRRRLRFDRCSCSLHPCLLARAVTSWPSRAIFTLSECWKLGLHDPPCI